MQFRVQALAGVVGSQEGRSLKLNSEPHPLSEGSRLA